jgi:flagellar motor protein MotB
MAEHPSDKDPGEVTQHILRELGHQHRSGGHSAHKHDEHDPDEHEEHIDERWLVSYADMMTLLFGLFVMLYAMAPQMNKVQESLSETFSKDPKPKSEPPPPVSMEQKLSDALQQMELLQTKLTERETASEALRLEVQTLLAKNKDLEENLLVERQKVPPSPSADLTDTLQKQVAELRRELAHKDAQIDKTPAKDETKPLINQINTLKRELSEKNKLLAAQNASLQADQSFIAVAISWPTKDHDVDLIVEDPSGAVFNYKARTHQKQAGNFVLDTRRGPGAELWQADRVYPGKYKLTYVFYNQYGNKEVAKVNGTIFTSKGSYPLRPTALDPAQSPKKEYSFTIDSAGKVVMQP